ncbi:unnamed protein product [Bursaphelenchus okinawaensis]|uniref:C2H2-type domain-containing protein n=1 Tax=Bursaphelenchus okinawaensis TaxID=465554 RepID=A0A811KVD1_9BILA|nr:unnamed protein product [Bursaphelenchus okinawaensis]CAG9112622.1 unnamed protein product [Bursaphelenchus okinawaensis]
MGTIPGVAQRQVHVTPAQSPIKYLAIPVDPLLAAGGNGVTIQIHYGNPPVKNEIRSQSKVASNKNYVVERENASSPDLASDPFLCSRMDDVNNGNAMEEGTEAEVFKANNEHDFKLNTFEDYNTIEAEEPIYEEYQPLFTEMQESPPPLFAGTVIKRSANGLVLPTKAESNIPKKYKCTFPNCGKTFERQRSLKYHHITHAPPVFSCDICDKSFVTMPKLKRHLRIHNGERPFLCDECGKAFSTNSNLNVHKRKHTGEKPFACSICGRLFAHHSHAKTHLKIHEKERYAF